MDIMKLLKYGALLSRTKAAGAPMELVTQLVTDLGVAAPLEVVVRVHKKLMSYEGSVLDAVKDADFQKYLKGELDAIEAPDPEESDDHLFYICPHCGEPSTVVHAKERHTERI